MRRRSDPASHGRTNAPTPMTHPGKSRLAAVSRVLPLIGALAFGTASSGAQEGQAAGNAAPIVPGYERLRDSDVVDDRARGEVLLGELNCMSCHAVSDPARNAIAIPSTVLSPDGV